MSDKMMRVAFRGVDGFAKALSKNNVLLNRTLNQYIEPEEEFVLVDEDDSSRFSVDSPTVRLTFRGQLDSEINDFELIVRHYNSSSVNEPILVESLKLEYIKNGRGYFQKDIKVCGPLISIALVNTSNSVRHITRIVALEV